jgi:hypothetical protein
VREREVLSSSEWLQQENTHKNGIACRRKTAGWDHVYLLKVLTADHHFHQAKTD